MRRVRYLVVMSLDGYIAGPKGEADWIITDPDFDFTAIFSQFDTILFGRRTFDAMVAARRVSIPGMKTNVFSQTLMQEDHPQVAIVANDQQETLALSRRAPERISGYSVVDRSSAVSPKTDSLIRSKSVLSRSFLVREFLCRRIRSTGSN